MKLKNNKSPGKSGKMAENLKCGGIFLQKQVLEQLKEICKTEKIAVFEQFNYFTNT